VRKTVGRHGAGASLGLSHRIVDLVDSGRTLKENGLVEIEHIAESPRASSSIAPPSRRSRRGSASGSIASARSAVPPKRFDASAGRKEFSAFSAQPRHPTRMSTGSRPTSWRRARPWRRRRGRVHRKFDRSTPTRRIAHLRRRAPGGRGQGARAQREALAFAAQRIEAFHRASLPKDGRLHRRHRHAARRALPAARVGRRLSCRAATAAYPSSVLMNIVPAKVRASPASSWSCRRRARREPAGHAGGRDRRRRRGLAHRRRAGRGGHCLRHQSIKPVDKITGQATPMCRRQAPRLRQVGIDLIAAPSEILVVADAQNDPAWIAADLLSQASHDASSQSVLIADDAASDAVAPCRGQRSSRR